MIILDRHHLSAGDKVFDIQANRIPGHCDRFLDCVAFSGDAGQSRHGHGVAAFLWLEEDGITIVAHAILPDQSSSRNSSAVRPAWSRADWIVPVRKSPRCTGMTTRPTFVGWCKTMWLPL